MPNNQRRKKDSARLTWSSKPRRAPNPKDIDFQTAEMVIPNPQRDQLTIAQFGKLAEVEGIYQPLQWEYLLLSESLFNSNRGQSFESLVPLCRVLTNQIIVEQNSRRQN